MYRVGITGTGSLIGQAIIKSIVRSDYAKDYQIIGFDYFKDTVGSFWCNKNFLLPDLLKKDMEAEWLNSLIRLITAEKIDILFVGVDFELPVLAKHKAKIERKTFCKVIVSSSEVIDTGNDKYKTFLFLKNNGLNYPDTWLPSECDPAGLKYPVIVKPRVGARSRGVSVVHSSADIGRALALANDPIIQEYVGHEAGEYTCGVIAFGSDIKATIALNRTLKEGNTYLSEFRFDLPKHITDYVMEITRKLKPFGSCNYQLRLDDKNEPKLFEINPRHSGTTYMRSLFGYNEVAYILQHVLEGKELPFHLKEGKAMRFYEEMLVTS